LIRFTTHPAVKRVVGRADDLLRGYPLDVEGTGNLPTSGPGVICATHQDGDDVMLVIASAFNATGRVISPLVDIDSGQSRFETVLLEMFDVTWTLRGSEPLAVQRRRESYDEMLAKALGGHLLAVWCEGTFCPRFDDVLGLYTGGSVRLALDFYDMTGQTMLDYPQVTAYEFDETGKIRAAHVEYLEPFDPLAHGAARDPAAATEALRKLLLAAKRALYARCMPNLTPEWYARFRAAGHQRHPKDPDYYDCGQFSLDYKQALAAGDERLAADILAAFAA